MQLLLWTHAKASQKCKPAVVGETLGSFNQQNADFLKVSAEQPKQKNMIEETARKLSHSTELFG